MGDLRVSEAMNGVLIALIGTGFPQASETGALLSSRELAAFGRRMRELETDIAYSVAHVGDSLPGDAGRAYARAMSVLTGADGGTNYLREYERSLRGVAAGHRDQSLNIQESKWQIVAELIRLLIELTILAATAWINPAAAGQAAAAKARSTTVFLTALDLFLRRTHLMPSLSEALEEAFQTLVVRLGLMAFNAPDMRPSGVDWRAVWQSAAFGAAAGWLSGPLRDLADRFNGLFTKNGNRELFKDLTGDVTSKSGRDLPGTTADAPQSFGQYLASSPRRVSEFVADGLTEAVPESLLAMAFFGTPFSWSAFATTFWTSAVSEQTTGLLGDGVTHGVGNVREAYDGARPETKDTAGAPGGPVPVASRGATSTTGTDPAGSALSAKGRSNPGTDVNRPDVFDRFGAPGVAAPTPATGTARGSVVPDAEGAAYAPRPTAGPGPRPVTESSAPGESAQSGSVELSGAPAASTVREETATLPSTPAAEPLPVPTATPTPTAAPTPTPAGAAPVPTATPGGANPVPGGAPGAVPSPATGTSVTATPTPGTPTPATSATATTGATPSPDGRQGGSPVVPEANRPAAGATVRTAAGPDGARTGDAPPPATGRPATTSSRAAAGPASEGAQPGTGPGSGRPVTGTSSTGPATAGTAPARAAADEDVPPPAAGTPRSALSSAPPADRAEATASSGNTPETADGRPEWDSLREGLAAAWEQARPTPHDLSTAHNIVRTHQKLPPFDPAERPSFATLDPGHLAVYAVALDLTAHHDPDRAEALSRRLAQGRPRAERAYLPAGTGRAREERRPMGDGAASGSSQRPTRVQGPRDPRPAAAPRDTSAPGPSRPDPTETAAPPAPATSTDTASPDKAPTAPTPVGGDRNRRPQGARQRVDAAPRPSAGSALPGHAPREVLRTVTVDERAFEVLRVEPDGECFMTSTLAGAARQLPGSALGGMTVRELRKRVGDWLAGNDPRAVARRTELDEGPSALSILVDDLTLAQLEDLLDHTAPHPTPAQLARIDADLSRPQFVRELVRRVADPADSSVVGDFTAGMAAALLPDFTPDPALIRAQDRRRLVHDLRLASLRQEAARALATVTPRSQALYTTLIGPHRGLARMFPLLQDMHALTPSAAAEHAVRNADMWTTPFYDQVPQLTALALDLNITPVQPAEGVDDLAFAHPLNPSAGQSLHVFYEGGNHYSAMNPVGGTPPVPSPAAAVGRPPTGARPANARPTGSQPPTTRLTPRELAQLNAVTAELRRHGASDDLIARLYDLSRPTVGMLAGMTPAARSHGSTATAPPSPAAGRGTPPESSGGVPAEPSPAVLEAAEAARSRRDRRGPATVHARPEPVVLTFGERQTDLGPDHRRELDVTVELLAEQALFNRATGHPLPVVEIDAPPARRARFALPGTRTRDTGAVREQAATQYLRTRLAEVLRDKQPEHRSHPVTADDLLVTTGRETPRTPPPSTGTGRAAPAHTVRITVDPSPPLNRAQRKLNPDALHRAWDGLADAVNPRREAALPIALRLVRAHQRVAGFRPEADPDFGDLPLAHRAVYAVAAAVVRRPRDITAAEDLARALAAHQPPPGTAARTATPGRGASPAGSRTGSGPAAADPLPAPPPVSGGTTFVTSGPVHMAQASPAPLLAPPAPPVGGLRPLALPLARRTPAGLRADLLAMTAGERQRIARDHHVIEQLRTSQSAEEFARTAAVLLVDVAPGVDQPVSARQEAHRLLAALLKDPSTAARVLTGGARVTVIPKDVPLTRVEPFTALAGRGLSGGRVWDDVRGTSSRNPFEKHTAISEENLLGAVSSLPGSDYADGYSTAVHELVHMIHTHGLDDTDRRTIETSFHDRLARGTGAQWPDGPRLDRDGVPTDNYSSTDPYEYFAQLSNAYLGVNTGFDAATGRPRNNGHAWVRAHESTLRPLLERLYGTTPTLLDSGPANPVEATREENERYAAVASLFPEPPDDGLAPPPADTPVGDLVRFDGPLTDAQTRQVRYRVAEFTRTARLSAARIVHDRLRRRADRLQGSPHHAAAEELRDWVQGRLAEVSGAPHLTSPPRTLHFFWVGRPLSPAAVDNVLAWAAAARDHGWTVNMWTDTTPVTMAGDRAPKTSLSTWTPQTEQALRAAGIRFRSVRDLLPRDRAGGSRLTDPRMRKLRTIYETARTTPTAFPVASDVTRLAIQLSEGGTYADVDLAPGTVDLVSGPSGTGGLDIPLIGPMFRDQQSFRAQREEFAEHLGVHPETMSTADVASYAMTEGRFGNALISAVPGAVYFRHVVDAIDDRILTWTAEELAAGGAYLTGPLTYTKGAFALSAAYGLGPVDDAELGAAIDPFEVRRWARLGWLTDESEHQVDRGTAGSPVPGQLPPPLPGPARDAPVTDKDLPPLFPDTPGSPTAPPADRSVTGAEEREEPSAVDEAAAASPVPGQEATPLVVRFPQGSRTPADGELRALRQLARRTAPELLRDHAAGLPPRPVRVKGRGNSADHAAYTGRTRAKNVAWALEGYLAAELRALQTGSPDPLTTEDLTIVYGYEDTFDQPHLDPHQRRTAVVVLGDEPPGDIPWTPLRTPGMRDRHERAETPTRVLFGRGDATVSDQGRRDVEDLADRIAARALRERGPGDAPIAITVKGGGNGRDTARSTGLARAAGVRAELEAALERRLRARQPEAEQPVTLGHFTIDTVHDDSPRALYEDPLTRRTATVTVDWPTRDDAAPVTGARDPAAADARQAEASSIADTAEAVARREQEWAAAADPEHEDGDVADPAPTPADGLLALRERLSARWPLDGPTADELTLAHNIVRTHQLLAPFEPQSAPDFATMDPGHLAVYAVALDLWTHDDEEHATRLSRDLARDRPRPVRGYLPGGSGKGEGKKSLLRKFTSFRGSSSSSTPEAAAGPSRHGGFTGSAAYGGPGASTSSGGHAAPISHAGPSGYVGPSGGSAGYSAYASHGAHPSGSGHAQAPAPYGAATAMPVSMPTNGFDELSAVQQFKHAPDRFLERNVLLTRTNEGMRRRFAHSGVDEGRFLTWMARQNRHWFVLTPDTGRRGSAGEPVYLLTPAVEMYAHEYAHDRDLRDILRGCALLPRRAPDTYVSAHFVEYKRGPTTNPVRDVGHTPVPVNGSMQPGGADFVFTPAMNGCALVVTENQTPGYMTVWHYQSPHGATNAAAAEEFRRMQRLVEWFGSERYMTIGAEGMPEVTNLMWRGPQGWQILSQENYTPPMRNDEVTLFVVRREVPAPGREPMLVALIHQGTAAEQLEELERVRASHSDAFRRGQDTAQVVRAYELLTERLRADRQTLVGVADAHTLLQVARSLKEAHEQTRHLVSGLLDSQDRYERSTVDRTGRPAPGSRARHAVGETVGRLSGSRWPDALVREASTLADRTVPAHPWSTVPTGVAYTITPVVPQTQVIGTVSPGYVQLQPSPVPVATYGFSPSAVPVHLGSPPVALQQTWPATPMAPNPGRQQGGGTGFVLTPVPGPSTAQVSGGVIYTAYPGYPTAPPPRHPFAPPPED
ncbi:hypothetical protein [Streptomyces heilongjiangensis]|uniref:Outer membrane channel protein CpnT-like N-terminal domain-containing protein n=1 Tax=Streptomyces heilongjiangensis TaxID=945052 RepID=A0ABW1BB20_9ACTN|nr:hypothetical protein [Streptomyces heilongjiangensis]MDC2950525.1 hypothetical protein [Streptomyces heilongjiangensis]